MIAVDHVCQHSLEIGIAHRFIIKRITVLASFLGIVQCPVGIMEKFFISLSITREKGNADAAGYIVFVDQLLVGIPEQVANIPRFLGNRFLR